MSLRRPRPPLTRRLPIALAAGALAVATAVAPALAADDPGQGHQNNQSGHSNSNSNNTGSYQQAGGNAQQGGGDQGGNGGDWGDQSGNQSGGNQSGGGNQAGGNHGDQGQYRGVVTAQKLALRSAPQRGSQVIRYAHKGDVVSIFCKVPGDKVEGNPLWYLLTDGTWAWGPARYIDTIGPAPRWC
ncbi:SH3 domain-containing protein [Streptomyces sp. enrichment culture]|uniref:SH3 domain-containing protein n=1 Tax=Streptomyces sp. enrichment culture TaxID=1795815 RepID=UPI003F54D8CA